MLRLNYLQIMMTKTNQFEISCRCGSVLTVNAGQAGCLLSCGCGQTVIVPSLRKLKSQAHATSTHLDSEGSGLVETSKRKNDDTANSSFEKQITAHGKTELPQIFLCHSSADKNFVRKIGNDLHTLMVNAWIDEWELNPGDSLHEKIGMALESSIYVGVVLSPSSVKSRWCNKELCQALSRETRSGQTVVLPLVLSSVNMPPFLEDKVYLDFRDEYMRPLSRLASLLHGVSHKRISRTLEAEPSNDLKGLRTAILKELNPSRTPMKKGYIVAARDIPLNFLGTKTGSMLVPFHRPELPEEEMLSEIQNLLSFPICKTDDERKAFLMLIALSYKGEELDSLPGMISPMIEIGDYSFRLLSRKIIDLIEPQFWDLIGEHLLKTLKTGKTEGGMVGFISNKSRIALIVRTHRGRFERVSDSLRGTLEQVLNSAINAMAQATRDARGNSVDGVALFDFFIEDADGEINRPFYISRAVSFFPLCPERLPSRLHAVLIHKAILTQEEIRMLDEVGK